MLPCHTLALILAPLAPLWTPDAPSPRVLAHFDDGPPTPRWVVVNDNVMGGRSTGGPRYHGGMLTFEGFTNTNGGGFSSLRSVPGEFDLADYDALTLRVRGDERTYRVDLRTDLWYDRHEVAYQARFRVPTDAPTDGGWHEVTIPFSAFFPTSKGDNITGRVLPLDPATVRSIGLSINDGAHAPFQLHVDEIRAVHSPIPKDIQDARATQSERLNTLLARLDPEA